MELQAGDRLVDETGEWEVVSPRPWTTVGGKRVSVRMCGRSGNLPVSGTAAGGRMSALRYGALDVSKTPD